MGPRFLNLSQFVRIYKRSKSTSTDSADMERVRRANADTFEALLGAVYLHEGLETALELASAHHLRHVDKLLQACPDACKLGNHDVVDRAKKLYRKLHGVDLQIQFEGKRKTKMAILKSKGNVSDRL